MLVAQIPGCATYCLGGRWCDGGGRNRRTKGCVPGNVEERARISVSLLEDS